MPVSKATVEATIEKASRLRAVAAGQAEGSLHADLVAAIGDLCAYLLDTPAAEAPAAEAPAEPVATT
jgi:pyruvate/2-oxoglutarate/acetoin dehydrogenase E1 component